MKKLFVSFLFLCLATAHAQTDTIPVNPFEGFEAFSITPQNDSIIIERYLIKLNAQFVEIEEDGNRVEINARYREGHVTYGPENHFKIFVFDGDQCGAHCNGMYYSVTQYDTDVVEEDSGFTHIESLQQVNEDRYAVVMSAVYEGTIGGKSLQLGIFIRGRNELYFEEAFKNVKKWPGSLSANYGERTVLFEIWNPWWGADNKYLLTYGPKDKKVTYSYTYRNNAEGGYDNFIPKNVRPETEGEAVQVTGEFILDNAGISHFKEQFDKINIPAE